MDQAAHGAIGNWIGSRKDHGMSHGVKIGGISLGAQIGSNGRRRNERRLGYFVVRDGQNLRGRQKKGSRLRSPEPELFHANRLERVLEGRTEGRCSESFVPFPANLRASW